MAYDDLQDLNLAGVQWELTEEPMATARKKTTEKQDAEPAPIQAAPRQVNVSDIDASISMGRTPTSVVPPIAPIQPMSRDTAVAMATRPGDMESLGRMIAEFNHPLRTGATNVVLPHTAQNPNGLVIITDIPGSDDDASGRILSGTVGELMDKMLAAIGMSRDNVSIVPLIFWRTPGGRTPTREEMDLARPFVNRAIELLRPRVILTLGTIAATEIADATLPRGHGVPVVRDNVTIMPIFHPNYLILKPAAKRDAWTALQTVQNLLKSA